MDLRIRILAQTELSLLREVADLVWPTTFQAILSPEQISYMLDLMYAPEVMEREYAEGIQFHGVFDGDKPIGYFTWGRCYSVANCAKLHKCYLLSDYQGQGIGTLMLKEVKNYAREAGFTHLRLNVNRHNAKAIKAYLRNGFQTVEIVDNPIGNGFVMNDYVMEVKL